MSSRSREQFISGEMSAGRRRTRSERDKKAAVRFSLDVGGLVRSTGEIDDQFRYSRSSSSLPLSFASWALFSRLALYVASLTMYHLQIYQHDVITLE